MFFRLDIRPYRTKNHKKIRSRTTLPARNVKSIH